MDTTFEILGYVPTVKQQEFHEAIEPIALMFGARAIGGSTALRMEMHRRAQSIPGFRYLLLRRTPWQIRVTHIEKVPTEMLRLGGEYRKVEQDAHYSNGSRGHFSGCVEIEDLQDLLQMSWDCVCLDSAETYTPDMLREVDQHQGSRRRMIRGSGNPLGQGAKFLRDKYLNDPSWKFITCKLSDNPYIDPKLYDERLLNIPTHVRSAWVFGEWDSLA